MPNPRMKQRRVVHKSTAGILKPIPEAVDLVGNPPPGLTTKTVALLHQRVTANQGNRNIQGGAANGASHNASGNFQGDRPARTNHIIRSLHSGTLGASR